MFEKVQKYFVHEIVWAPSIVYFRLKTRFLLEFSISFLLLDDSSLREDSRLSKLLR